MSRKYRTPKVKTIHEPLVPPSAPPPQFTARSRQQAAIFAAYRSSDLLILTGPPDTAKSFSACLMAWQDVQAGLRDRIVVYRPAVAADEDLGFAPGTYAEKLAPWVEPITEAFTKIAGKDNKQIKHVLECKSLGQARGLTFERTVVIVTEAQNCTASQLRLICTRLGMGSRLIIEGDPFQCDLPKNKSGLLLAISKLKGLPGVTHMELTEEPSNTPHTRHPLVRAIVKNWPS